MNINFNSINDIRACLMTLVSLGNEAQRKLNSLEKNRHYSWETLFGEFEAATSRAIPLSSVCDYKRWMTTFASWATARGLSSPILVTRKDALLAVGEIWGNRVSSIRIIGFFKRVWKTLGLDESTWNFSVKVCSSEFYRRLSLHEVNRLHRHLLDADRELADIVALGYYTGLRLSDITELESSEVDLRRLTLAIVPNKLRTRKPRTLKIPLIATASEIVKSRMQHLYSGRYLFSARCRKHPSRKISRAFRACKIGKTSQGRASFHSIRATFISMMDDAQTQPYLTDAITGHASRTMHGRYSQPSVQALRRALLKALPPLSASDGISET